MHPQQKHELHVVIEWLKENFPRAFPRKALAVRPLQLGILEDILDHYDRLTVPPFSKKKLKMGLSMYTSSKAYLKAHKPGVMRINLWGEEVEPVSESQAEYAQNKLEARSQKKQIKGDVSK